MTTPTRLAAAPAPAPAPSSSSSSSSSMPSSSLPSSSLSLSSEEQDALKASIFQRLHPRAYLERFVAEGFRPDGRTFGAWRDVSVNTGSISTADGSALVRLGDSTVVCGVKAEIAEPELDAGSAGFLVPNLDLPAMCSPRFKPGPPTEEAQVLSDRLNEILIASGTLPLASLCIEPRKAVWAIYVDAVCINYDGNALDAALIAMVAALKNARIPKATYNPETRQTLCSRTDLRPLAIGSLPTVMSFGVFDGKHVLSDPTSFEEPLLDTTVSVALDETGALVSVSQIGMGLAAGVGVGAGAGVGGGGADSEEDVITSCISEAKKRHAALLAGAIYE